MEVRTGEGKYEALPGIRVRGRESSKLWVHGMYEYLVWRSYMSIVPFFVGFGSRPFGRRPVRSWPFCFELFFASADLAPSLRVLAQGSAFEGSNFHIEKQQ